MKRNEWEFPYRAKALAVAATRKKAHHALRLAWWLKKQDGVMLEIKDKGIEIHEGVAAQYSTSRIDPSVGVRVDLARDLAECSSKIREHRTKAEEYSGWAQVFAAAGDKAFRLHADDWLFFFSSNSKELLQ